MIIEKNELYSLIQKNEEKFQYFQNLVIKFNDIYNLTSIEEDDFFDKHFYDSLSVLPLIKQKEEELHVEIQIADVGSGAGFPSIPLLIVKPELNITLIESNHKRAEFLNFVLKEFNLKNSSVICSNVKEIRERYNFVMFRAFSSLSHFFKISKNIFENKTIILAMKGKLSEINKEISIVKNEKIWKYITDLKIDSITGFPWERNIVEIIWEKL